jgi:hypothetical protein
MSTSLLAATLGEDDRVTQGCGVRLTPLLSVVDQAVANLG